MDLIYWSFTRLRTHASRVVALAGFGVQLVRVPKRLERVIKPPSGSGGSGSRGALAAWRSPPPKKKNSQLLQSDLLKVPK